MRKKASQHWLFKTTYRGQCKKKQEVAAPICVTPRLPPPPTHSRVVAIELLLMLHETFVGGRAPFDNQPFRGLTTL